MKLSIKWFDGKYPQFNLMIASQEGKDPFIEVKGCRIVSGSDGEFVSGPSTKGATGKYWNHIFMSKEFSEVVLRLAKATQPKQEQQPQQEKKPAPSNNGGFDDISGDIPF